MNVVILSDHDHQGGAAIATCRIEAAISQEMVMNDMQSNVDRVVFFSESKKSPNASLWHEESRLDRWLRALPRRLFPSRYPRPNTPEFAAQRLREALACLDADIINVHNLHAAAPWGWGPHLIDVCLEFAPVVWTLHDMWAFTGRCAYAYDCEKFITGCDSSCPTPTEIPQLAPERIRAAWEDRRQIYGRHRDRLAVVTPSQWLADQARRGMFAGHRVEMIPYGLPLNADRGFAPVPQEKARDQLGIRSKHPVLLLAAFDLSERRKGAHILPHLWRHIQHRPLTVVTMGRGTITIDDPLIEVHPLGYLDDDLQKTLAYSAADALLHPAPVDNFPNVVLESLACGTPVIAMPVGGVPEMVRPGISGWLAESATPEALGRAIDRALHDLSMDKSLRESCRTLTEKEYSLELQGRRYFELFQQLLGRA